jgi:phage-related protein
MREAASAGRRRWRHYETPSGRRPTKEFVDGLTVEDRASVLAAMAEVRDVGLAQARHLRGDVYEVRAPGVGVAYRILFAKEGSRGRILLALHAFSKKSQKTPTGELELALRRLSDWRARESKH